MGQEELLAREYSPFRYDELSNRTRPKGQENYLQASISPFRYDELLRNKTSCFEASCQLHMFCKHYTSVLLLLRQLSICVSPCPRATIFTAHARHFIVLSMTEGRNLALAYEASSQSQTIFSTTPKSHNTTRNNPL